MSRRHAFIILAHGKMEQLQMLLDSLEDPDFDLYLHLDAQAETCAGWLKEMEARHQRLTVLPRMMLYWGDVSLVDAELRAFSTVLAQGRGYSHIHLMSGQDLPLRSPMEIKEFFKGREDIEFVDVRSREHTNYPHVRCWMPFPKYLKYKNGSRAGYRLVKMLNQLAYISEKLILMHLWRDRSFEYRQSSQWVSITPAFASYLVSRRDGIMRRYAHAIAPDEFFLATELWNSPFRDSTVKDNLRYIKWKAPHSPHPFIIEMKDYEQMIASGALFARKFDLNVDRAVAERVIGRWNP